MTYFPTKTLSMNYKIAFFDSKENVIVIVAQFHDRFSAEREAAQQSKTRLAVTSVYDESNFCIASFQAGIPADQFYAA